MSSVSRGHGRERDWMDLLTVSGRFACRPRWAVVDVLSMFAGEATFFDEVKSDQLSPYENFRPSNRKKLLAVAALAGAEARLIWWPLSAQYPTIIPAKEWPV